MSTRSSSLSITTAALAAVTWAGSALAADLPVKAPAPAPESPFFIVNDNSVSFTWAPSATDPGVDINGHSAFSKYTGEFTHFDVWQYGTNLIDLNYIKSDGNDPVQGVPGATGAVEEFALWRSTLGGNQLTHSKMFSSFLFKNIELEFGGNFNTENNQLSPSLQAYVIGPRFDFNLPGQVALAVLAYKEFNHNQFLATGAFTGDTDFKWAPRLELDITEPLPFVPWPVTFINHTAVTFPKGAGISQANMNALCALPPNDCTQSNALSQFTKTEVRADSRLSLDASKLWFNKPGIWDVYVGYRYWYNKFGTDHNAVLFSEIAPNTSIESTAYLGMTYHFK
jgi:hypothetical protein